MQWIRWGALTLLLGWAGAVDAQGEPTGDGAEEPAATGEGDGNAEGTAEGTAERLPCQRPSRRDGCGWG